MRPQNSAFGVAGNAVFIKHFSKSVICQAIRRNTFSADFSERNPASGNSARYSLSEKYYPSILFPLSDTFLSANVSRVIYVRAQRARARIRHWKGKTRTAAQRTMAGSSMTDWRQPVSIQSMSD